VNALGMHDQPAAHLEPRNEMASANGARQWKDEWFVTIAFPHLQAHNST
jgi:hypothetical protein